MTIGILILAVFLVAALLMFLRKLPAMFALPLMATAIVGIEIAAGRLTWEDLTRAVIADGSVRLADAMIISMFGGMLSILMQKAGVAESMVRRGAELAGDSPWVVAAIMLGIITVLFTTIGGLGAVIMVGTIVLPILSSIGLKEHIGAGIMLFGISLGGVVNPTNWVVYRTVLALDSDVVSSYALLVFGVVTLVGLAFVTVELWRSHVIRLRIRGPVRMAAAVVSLAVVGGIVSKVDIGGGTANLAPTLDISIAIGGTGVLLYAVVDVVRRTRARAVPAVRWYAYLIPLVPLVLILVFKMAYVAAFTCGLLYGILVTYRRGSLNMTARSVIEGSASVVPAIVLMMGIGILLSAILGPTRFGAGRYWYDQLASYGANPEWPVLADMKPLLQTIVPASWVSYVATFTLLGPLALYRGPLNVWGLGYGVGGVLLATGVPAGAVMGILMSLGMIQGVSDPTNTQNVWIANEVRLDVTSIMWKTLPYSWLAAVLGLIVAGFTFMM